MTKKNKIGGNEHGRRNGDKHTPNSRRITTEFKPRVCEIEVTKACNLRCKHCYANAGLVSPNELSTEEILAMLDENPSIKEVILTGGEPFMRKDFMELLEQIIIRNISVNINTNGLLLTEQKVIRLTEMGITNIQISIDGLEANHDLIRGLSGAFKKTIIAIKLCISLGIKVEVGTVLTGLNKEDIIPLIKLCKKMGVKKFSVDKYIPSGRAIDESLNIGMNAYVSLISKISDVSKLQPQKELLPRCGVGHEKIVVLANGDIVPCVAMPDIITGNIRTSNLTKTFTESKVFEQIRSIESIPACADCPSKMICCGGCRARAYAMTGEISSPDEAHCRLHQINK